MTQENPCDCPSCPNLEQEEYPGKSFGDIVCKILGATSRHKDCMYHPLARECLMRDMIEGLQYIVSEVGSTNHWEKSLKLIRRKAIALIKAGVKK